MFRQVMLWDPFDPEFLANPYPTYRRLREAAPVQRAPGGMWVATGYREVGAALRDPSFGNMDNPDLARPVPRTPEGEPMISFQLMNPPNHTRLRNLVSKSFNARVVEQLRPRVQRIVDDLLDAAGTGEVVDFVSAFAYPLPLTVICELIGVPEQDRGLFRKWANALARGLDPDIILTPETMARRDQARMEFFTYFLDLADRRRREPQDDLMTKLVRVEDDGDVLTATELAMTCILLLVAGHETTVNLMGNGTVSLSRNPDQMEYLRTHPEGIGAAVEELLRYDAPVQFTARTALREAKLGDQPIAAGEPIVLVLGAANRDPAVFPDPDRLDLSRPPVRHLAFGLGIHFCLGLPLARLEGEIAFTALARRGVQLATERLTYKENLTLRGLAELPVRIGAR
jgi:unspecific monooxygenase